MKRVLLGAAAAAMALTGFAAQAQPYRAYDGYSRGYYDQHQGWNRGYDRDHDRYEGHRYDRDRYDHDRYDDGRYDRDRGGDTATAAVAGGVIGLVLGSMLSDHGTSYAQPSYGYYQQPYGYAYPSYSYPSYRGW